jgi:hypothetical protein
MRAGDGAAGWKRAGEPTRGEKKKKKKKKKKTQSPFK